MIREQIPAFEPQAFLAIAGRGKTILNPRKKELLFSQGDAADAVFYIRTGRVRLTAVSPRGKEAVVAILGPSHFFGEGCLAAQPERMTTAKSMADSTIVRIEKAAMVRVLHKEKTFSALFMAYLLSHNVRIEEELVEQLFNSSEKRLARILLLLANFGREEKREIVIPKMSQETLAEMIGASRSKVRFFMNKFKKLGFIRYDGELRVHNSLLNIVLQD